MLPKLEVDMNVLCADIYVTLIRGRHECPLCRYLCYFCSIYFCCRGNLILLFLFQTGNLAMESLLSLTSRRAGEWFKEELRTLGALDHIVDTGTC